MLLLIFDRGLKLDVLMTRPTLIFFPERPALIIFFAALFLDLLYFSFVSRFAVFRKKWPSINDQNLPLCYVMVDWDTFKKFMSSR